MACGEVKQNSFVEKRKKKKLNLSQASNCNLIINGMFLFSEIPTKTNDGVKVNFPFNTSSVKI